MGELTSSRQETADKTDAQTNRLTKPAHRPLGTGIRSYIGRLGSLAGLSGSLPRQRLWRPRGEGSLQEPQFEEEPDGADRRLLSGGLLLAGGVFLYFQLPEEPNAPTLIFLSVVLWLSVWIGRHHAWRSAPLLIAAWLVLGASAGASRTMLVDAPKLSSAGTFDLAGRVERIEMSARGRRLIIRLTSLSKHRLAEMPKKVRISVPDEPDLGVGDHITARARLFPPSGPVTPGGYDFSFRAYFMGIGASGFSYGKPFVVPQPDQEMGSRYRQSIEAVRWGIANRILALSGEGPSSAVAIALLVGLRGYLPENVADQLRQSGLAHMLAISGLHMALVAGGIFAGLTVGFACLPPGFQRIHIHKVAAALALLAATAYLLLSGASIATERAYIMICLVFLGTLAGRRGITLRSVAIAGIVLMLLNPEFVVFPGFQMSFMAVVCLIGVHETWRKIRKDRSGLALANRDIAHGLTQKVWRGLLALLVTSLVAGTATGIIGLYHFGRIAPYGVIANMLAMPVFGFIVMPFGVLVLLLMPFGLAKFPLMMMIWGIDWTLEIAAGTAAATPNAGYTVPLSAVSALLLVGSLLALIFLRKRMKLTAIGLAIPSIALALMARPPDIHLGAAGARLAFRDADGALRTNARQSGFAVDTWFRQEGVAPHDIAGRKVGADQWVCDAAGCRGTAYGAKGREHVDVGRAKTQDGSMVARHSVLIAQPKTSFALLQDCRRADVIITDLQAPQTCAASIVMDASFRRRNGASAIWIEQHGLGQFWHRLSAAPADRADRPRLRIKTSKPVPHRPWHRSGQ